MNEPSQRMPVPPGYSVQNVWEGKSDALIQELTAFWLGHRALPSAEAAAKRAPQVVCVVRNEAGALVGASTVYREVHPRFGVQFFHFRCFVAQEHRRASLASVLVIEVARYFEERFKAGHDQDVLGVFIELQNDAVQKTMNQAVWPFVPFVYAGKTKAGAIERVFFFEGARI